MARRRTWLGILVAAGALGLAACSSGTPSTPSSSSTSSSTSTVPTTGLNPDSAFCHAWTQAASQLKTVTTSAAAIESMPLAQAKQNATALTDRLAQAATTLSGATSSAPAGVQSEVATLSDAITLEKDAIAGATSTQAIVNSFETELSTPKITAAAGALQDYNAQQCGHSST